jgi:O-antigen/teichoic acid export membrane protein
VYPRRRARDAVNVAELGTEEQAPAVASGNPPDVLDTSAAGGLIVRGGILRFGSYVGVVALSVISVVLLTRYLGVARFSAYTTVISLVTVVSMVTDSGMSNLGTREFAMRGGAERDALMRDLLGLRVALTLGGVALATLFALCAGYSVSLLAGTAIASLATIALVYQHTLSIPLTAELRVGTLSLLDLGRQLLTVIAIVALVVVGAGLLPLLAVTLGVYLVLIPMTAMLVRGQISLRLELRPRRWLSLLRLTVVFSMATAVGTIYMYTAQILTSLVTSAHQSGLFAASFRVFIVMAAVPGMLVATALPVLARAARDDRSRLGYALQRTFEVSAIVGCAAAIGVVTGAHFIIAVIAGPKFAGAAAALRIEGVALLASFVLSGWGFGLLALERYRELLLANLAAFAVSASLTLFLAQALGARGAAVASVCGEFTLGILCLLGLIRGSPELRPKLGVVLKAALAAAPAVAVGFIPGLPSVLAPLAALAVFAALMVALRAVPEELYELIPGRSMRSS